MTGTYSLGGVNVEVGFLYRKAYDFCADYLTDAASEVRVVMMPEDIDRERAIMKKIAEIEGGSTEDITDENLEITAALRKIADELIKFDVFLMHGSAIAVDGFGYLFTARSGTGKSTHTRLWREMLGNRAVMINDDKPLIRISENGCATAYGTPWNGKHRLGNRSGIPLKAICILQRSKENSIRKISKTEAYPMLLQQIYRPESLDGLQLTLQMIDRMQVDYWRLGCNMEPDAAETAYRAMSGT